MRKRELLLQLSDERAIATTLHTYARALDTRDWDLLASVFTPTATVDYTAEGGPVCIGPEAVIADCRADFEGLDATQHLIGNIVIAVRGDRADATCYVNAWHHSIRPQGGSTLLLVGGYRDELVRVASGWKIERRALQVAFQTGNPSVKIARPDSDPSAAEESR